MSRDQRRRRLWIECILAGTGSVCLVWWGAVSLQATLYQSRQRAVLERMRMVPSAAIDTASVLPSGSLIGSLEIPRLHMSAMIANGDDEATLNVAIGHLPDTPLPWHEGNSALAGHRDTFFRSLQHIRVGDELRLSTFHGDFRYQVRETMVVSPRDVWILGPTDRPILTLITCYPFSNVGNAPRRFVVRAERVTTAAKEQVQPAKMAPEQQSMGPDKGQGRGRSAARQ